jgi:hypothetical protein
MLSNNFFLNDFSIKAYMALNLGWISAIIEDADKNRMAIVYKSDGEVIFYKNLRNFDLRNWKMDEYLEDTVENFIQQYRIVNEVKNPKEYIKSIQFCRFGTDPYSEKGYKMASNKPEFKKSLKELKNMANGHYSAPEIFYGKPTPTDDQLFEQLKQLKASQNSD